jgi:hypothetical protein
MKLIEAPPAPPRRPGTYQPWNSSARRHPLAHLLESVVRVGWWWRVELAAVLLAVTVWNLLTAVVSVPVAAILVAGLLAAVVVPARIRARLGWIEQRARLRSAGAAHVDTPGWKRSTNASHVSPGSPKYRSGKCCGFVYPQANPALI